MTIKTIHIDNYRHFREIFEDAGEAEAVMENLRNAIQEDIGSDETGRIMLQYWVHYDDEGLAGFETVQAQFADDRANVNVRFISTAK